MMPQLLIEIRQVYWNSNDFDSFRTPAMNSAQSSVLVKFPFHFTLLL